MKKNQKKPRQFKSAKESSDVVNAIVKDLRKSTLKHTKGLSPEVATFIICRVVNSIFISTYRPLIQVAEERLIKVMKESKK